ncbi:hypothetical protein L226DRAFT_312719 [Lentinus tigrinus ALCF2SS1-7]|uniref:Uncharacterized protein n=1 Tax=Lentinus tigrinus ALCF2SS1-6 TaxID=1328759 RepID=A0A5C2RT55_9APHY|nr:hypothetical protein L227DRAFT_370836 [Lentinus tigrinus ALCF2SS1-6]RPD68892.1 hypothetical protein L226DRAFT_312719 [Lentinus tigrinus ALCF2SS1-7]
MSMYGTMHAGGHGPRPRGGCSGGHLDTFGIACHDPCLHPTLPPSTNTHPSQARLAHEDKRIPRKQGSPKGDERGTGASFQCTRNTNPTSRVDTRTVLNTEHWRRRACKGGLWTDGDRTEPAWPSGGCTEAPARRPVSHCGEKTPEYVCAHTHTDRKADTPPEGAPVATQHAVACLPARRSYRPHQSRDARRCRCGGPHGTDSDCNDRPRGATNRRTTAAMTTSTRAAAAHDAEDADAKP